MVTGNLIASLYWIFLRAKAKPDFSVARLPPVIVGVPDKRKNLIASLYWIFLRAKAKPAWLLPVKKPNHQCGQVSSFVGVARFELATPRPPDVYSNRAELHPDLCLQR